MPEYLNDQDLDIPLPTIDSIDLNDPALMSTMNDFSFSSSDLTIGGGGSIDTITLTSPIPSVTISSIGGSGSVLGVNANGAYGWSDLTSRATAHMSQSGRLSLQGDNADIDINGVSLMETLKTIQDQLNILRPNKELEAEWDQLRELGEQYRKLEAEFKEKQKVWEALKQQG